MNYTKIVIKYRKWWCGWVGGFFIPPPLLKKFVLFKIFQPASDTGKKRGEGLFDSLLMKYDSSEV